MNLNLTDESGGDVNDVQHFRTTTGPKWKVEIHPDAVSDYNCYLKIDNTLTNRLILPDSVTGDLWVNLIPEDTAGFENGDYKLGIRLEHKTDANKQFEHQLKIVLEFEVQSGTNQVSVSDLSVGELQAFFQGNPAVNIDVGLTELINSLRNTLRAEPKSKVWENATADVDHINAQIALAGVAVDGSIESYVNKPKSVRNVLSNNILEHYCLNKGSAQGSALTVFEFNPTTQLIDYKRAVAIPYQDPYHRYNGGTNLGVGSSRVEDFAVDVANDRIIILTNVHTIHCHSLSDLYTDTDPNFPEYDGYLKELWFYGDPDGTYPTNLGGNAVDDKINTPRGVDLLPNGNILVGAYSGEDGGLGAIHEFNGATGEHIAIRADKNIHPNFQRLTSLRYFERNNQQYVVCGNQAQDYVLSFIINVDGSFSIDKALNVQTALSGRDLTISSVFPAVEQNEYIVSDTLNHSLIAIDMDTGAFKWEAGIPYLESAGADRVNGKNHLWTPGHIDKMVVDGITRYAVPDESNNRVMALTNFNVVDVAYAAPDIAGYLLASEDNAKYGIDNNLIKRYQISDDIYESLPVVYELDV